MRKQKRVLAIVLAILVVNSGMDYTDILSAHAKEESSRKEITSFKALPSDISLQEIAVGTEEKEINLPDSLRVMVSNETASQQTDAVEEEKLTEQQEKELTEQQEKELTDQQEKELTEQQEKELTEQQEKELTEQQEKELTDQREKGLTDQQEKKLTEQQEEKSAEQQENAGGQNDEEEIAGIGFFLTDIANTFAPMTAYAKDAEEEITIENIRWYIDAEKSASPSFASGSEMAGESFYYVPEIPEEYDIADNLSLPQIKVTITAKTESRQLISDWTWAEDTDDLWIQQDETTKKWGLGMPNVSKDHQADFDTVVSMLPTIVKAVIMPEDTVSSSNADQTEELALTWSCDTYVYHNESGSLPISGEHLFTANLPQGYELSENAKNIEVTLRLGGGNLLAVGDTFQVTTKEGVAVTYKILTEPSGDNPGTVQIGSGNDVAVNDNSISALTLPDSVERDGKAYTVTGIGRSAFFLCTNLELDGLPAGVTSIERSAFSDCEKLALTSLPAGVTSIGESAFYGCPKLALTSLPAGVTSIGMYAFCGCEKLALTSLPNGVTEIKNSAFSGCGNLTSISLPAGVTSIENLAFKGCGSLATVSCLSLTAPALESRSFEDCPITNLIIPKGATGYSAGNWTGIAGGIRTSQLTISGKATDGQSNPLEGVTVELCRENTNTVLATATTNAAGGYNLGFVDANVTYTITASKAGFSTKTISRAVAEENVTENFQLVGIVATPVISPNGGSFRDKQTVTITCATPGAAIYYTTDGQEPTEASTRYAGQFEVERNVTVKAKAYKNGMAASETASAVFRKPASKPETPTDKHQSSTGGTGTNSNPSDGQKPTPVVPQPSPAPAMPQPSQTPVVSEPNPTSRQQPESAQQDAPFIKDERGNQGWEAIKKQIEQTQEGKTIQIDMNDSENLSADVLDTIKGKDITLELDMGDGISWLINGKDIISQNLKDVNLRVDKGSKNIPLDVINKVTGERYSIQITLTYEGEFGFTAYLKVDLDAKNAGLYANLFYYPQDTGELEFVTHAQIGEDGSAAIPFTHASDYVIVVDDHPLDDSDHPDLAKTEDTDSEPTDSEPTEEVTQPPTEASQKEAWNPTWFIVIGIIIAVIAGSIYFVWRKKENT